MRYNSQPDIVRYCKDDKNERLTRNTKAKIKETPLL
jgi:hypothetical protein